MTSIRIYMEGGGNSKSEKADLRQGMNGLLDPFITKIRAKKGWRWDLIPCGGRQQTYNAFMNAWNTAKAEEIILLLVDSEGPIKTTRKDHLRRNKEDGWDLSEISEDNIHLMVQAMESWILADPEKLASVFGHGFRENCLPRRPNLEDESKEDCYRALSKAIRGCESGRDGYQKIKHAAKILPKLRIDRIRQRCPHADLFFRRLDELIDNHKG